MNKQQILEQIEDENENQPSFKDVVGVEWVKLRRLGKDAVIKKYLMDNEYPVNSELYKEDFEFYKQFHIEDLLDRVYFKKIKEYEQRKITK